MINHEPIIELPHYATTLIGRNRARTALIELLNTPEKRFISLIGTSGAGKTRLALQVAQEASPRYDRVVFIALAAVRFPVFVLPTIAHTLGISEAGDSSLVELLTQSFTDQRLLLILDNFEQVVSAGPTISKLIERMPNLTVLVTSQIPLETSQETIFEVPPLSLPSTKDLELSEALSYSAIQLFEDRIKHVQPHFKLQHYHTAAVIEICQRVRGLPLAIELVAGHSQVLDPNDLLMLLRNHLAMGRTMGISGSGSRQEMLWPVLDWSYRMLDESLRTLFDRLGVFWGGCTVESAEAICNYDQELKIDIQTGLNVLVAKNLVQIETLPDQRTRYIMLDAVQEYTSEHLQKQRDSEKLQNQHALYYLDVSRTAYLALGTSEQSTWFQLISEDINNFRRALNWNISYNHIDHALETAGNILTFWQMQGSFTEGRKWLAQAWEQTHGKQISPAVLAKARNAEGILAWGQADLDQAEGMFREVQAIYTQTKDTLGLAKTLSNLGGISYARGNYQAALDNFLEALTYFESINDSIRIGAIMSNIGVMYSILGDEESGYAYKQKTLEIQRQLQVSQTDLALTLNNLGIDAISLERFEEAESYLQEAHALLESTALSPLVGLITYNMAIVQWHQGHKAAAQQYATRSIYIWHDIGDTQHIADSLIVLGLVFAESQPILMTKMLALAEQQRCGKPLLPYIETIYSAVKADLSVQLATDWEAIWQTEQDLNTLLAEFEQHE